MKTIKKLLYILISAVNPVENDKLTTMGEGEYLASKGIGNYIINSK